MGRTGSADSTFLTLHASPPLWTSPGGSLFPKALPMLPSGFERDEFRILRLHSDTCKPQRGTRWPPALLALVLLPGDNCLNTESQGGLPDKLWAPWYFLELLEPGADRWAPQPPHQQAPPTDLFPQVLVGLTQGSGVTESIQRSLSSADGALPCTS